MASQTAAVMQMIATAERREGLRLLSECFQWHEFAGDRQRQHLHQEFVYEIVMFAANQAFPWHVVPEVAKMSKELLTRLKGCERDQAIELIAESVDLPGLSEECKVAVFTFIAERYAVHQQLYQTFLGLPQPDIATIALRVETPPQLLPLREGMTINEWERQQTLKRLNLAQQEKQAELQRLREQAGYLHQRLLEATLQDISAPEGNQGKEEIEKMTRTILQVQGEKMMEVLMKEVALTKELLELKIQVKTSTPPAPAASNQQKGKR